MPVLTKALPMKMSNEEIGKRVSEAVTFVDGGKNGEALNIMLDISKSILSYKPAPSFVESLKPDAMAVLTKVLANGGDVSDAPEVFWAFRITDEERSLINSIYQKYLGSDTTQIRQ